MASILFDDITFPRELYDPDTLEFAPPVSTLLAFTPHILSQLATTAENQQEPMPFQPPAGTSSQDSKTSDTAPEHPTKPSLSSSSTGFFSTFQNLASSHGTQKILENGFYLAGRYMDGSSSGASTSNQYKDHDRYGSSSSWFRYQDDRDHERKRLVEMERRLELMEQQMWRNSAMSRSEIDAQRRARHKLEQELEAQKQKVKKMEAELEEHAQTAKKEKEGKQEKERAAVQRAKSKGTDEGSKEEEADTKVEKSGMDGSSLPVANTMVMASIGAASLVMSLYAVHRASSTHSVVSFHDQLEQLMAQCEGVVQSTEAWISEQFLEVPDQIREDLKMIKELMETIQRLDPRSEKKIESVAWSMSAVGSLGAVGGAVLGSMAVMAGGGTLVVGCALFGIINRARYNGPEYKGARTMMELKAARILRSLGINPASSTASGGTRASLIHDGRIERLRFEFERRDGLDIRDADEIDGLVVEEPLQGLFSAPPASQTASAMASRSRRECGSGIKEREGL